MTNPTDDRPGSGSSRPGSHDEAGETRHRADAHDASASEDRHEREPDDRARRRSHQDRHGHRRRHGRHGRKERVLHTRISEQLSEDIRRLAEDLRVPTSNLVRNVLEEVFTVVESVSDDVGEIFDDVLSEAESARERIRRQGRARASYGEHRSRREGRRSSWADVAEEEIRRDEAREAVPPAEPQEPAPPPPPPRPPRPAFEEVVGWQPLVLNQTQDCASCGRSIRRGSRAFVGQTEEGLSRTALCRQCLS